MDEDYEELIRMLAEIDEKVRTITKDWNLPEHVRSRPIIDIETDLL